MAVIQAIALPFEFSVLGTPISHQTKNKTALNKWKKAVYQKATEVVAGRTPIGEPCHVTITHFFIADEWESGVPDSDNIVKPVRDALNGLIYVDDYQISDFLSRRRSLNGQYRIKGMSSALAEGFISGGEFLHIILKSAPDPTSLTH